MRFSQSLFYISACFISMNVYAIRNATSTNQFQERTLVHFQIGRNTCSGIRISNDYALSAAHCFSKLKRNSKFKAIFMNGNALLTKTIKSNKVKIYGKNSSPEDLAVIKITPSKPALEPAEIVTFDRTKLSQHKPGDVFTVLGFGTDHKGKIDQLNRAKVQFHDLFYEDDSPLIRVKPTKTNSNPCTGDSGGPLLKTNKKGERTLVGIISFISSTNGSLTGLNQTQQCNKANRAYYVPIVDHLNFIEQFIDL